MQKSRSERIDEQIEGFLESDSKELGLSLYPKEQNRIIRYYSNLEIEVKSGPSNEKGNISKPLYFCILKKKAE